MCIFLCKHGPEMEVLLLVVVHGGLHLDGPRTGMGSPLRAVYQSSSIDEAFPPPPAFPVVMYLVLS